MILSLSFTNISGGKQFTEAANITFRNIVGGPGRDDRDHQRVDKPLHDFIGIRTARGAEIE